MTSSILVAGIGNIFQGDDAFGVTVAQRLSAMSLPSNVNVTDIGIRGIDLAFALLDRYDLTILVDATARGGAPGTLYTIEIGPDDIPDNEAAQGMMNAHSLDPGVVLSLAKELGARFQKILLVGCEPQIVDCDDTGHIGLSDAVEAAVEPALELIREIVETFNPEITNPAEENEEVLHEFS
jgi:hydrogenase maturation protease